LAESLAKSFWVKFWAERDRKASLNCELSRSFGASRPKMIAVCENNQSSGFSPAELKLAGENPKENPKEKAKEKRSVHLAAKVAGPTVWGPQTCA